MGVGTFGPVHPDHSDDWAAAVHRLPEDRDGKFQGRSFTLRLATFRWSGERREPVTATATVSRNFFATMPTSSPNCLGLLARWKSLAAARTESASRAPRTRHPYASTGTESRKRGSLRLMSRREAPRRRRTTNVAAESVGTAPPTSGQIQYSRTQFRFEGAPGDPSEPRIWP